ncbi:tetratricopeptide repeat protein [Hydrogenophaga sp.]|uniref:tetratricopeptide repeat protein n=1 Tax=Hydrogenophaga sp. TaxID=1904254 RepID=UPI0025BB4340|nr:tetratricopeptide repeat protein [Hydrogenophaga sp.]
MSNPLDKARTLFVSGNAHFEAGRLEAALADFDAALAHSPGRPSLLVNRGATLCRLARWEEALPTLQAAAQVDPDHADAWAAMGLAQQALGQWAAATESLQRAHALGLRDGALCLALADCQMRLERPGAALAAVDQALAADASLAEAWSLRGNLMREAGRLTEAAAAFDQALVHGGHPELHRFYLASVRSGEPVPPHPPRAYVESLFDDYAPDFQQHLLQDLKYQAHSRLLAPILAEGRRWPLALDLGCGSGLCGQLLAPVCDAVDGVDVSRVMVEQATASGDYRRVHHADLLPFLTASESLADLIVAADVFIYVGALDDALPAAAQRLAPGGILAFSVEQADPGHDLQLRPSLRYAHGRAAIERLATSCGLSVRALWAAAIREDQRQPVMGWYALLQRSDGAQAAS